MDDPNAIKPLSPETRRLAESIWSWFPANGFSSKPMPQFQAAECCYHVWGVIGINDTKGSREFPLPAIILEEILHYVTSTEDLETGENETPEVSADYSPQYLRYILDRAAALADVNEFLGCYIREMGIETDATTSEDRFAAILPTLRKIALEKRTGTDFQSRLIRLLWDRIEPRIGIAVREP